MGLHPHLRTAAATLAAVSMVLMAPRAAAPSRTSTLGVSGRTNATPWIAAAGSFVAVAWGASSEGKTDVFVAVSRDAGATFQAAVQVNGASGEARLGGELPPRVALASPHRGAADPDIVVLWTARGSTTETKTAEIKTSRSRDGGKTFEPAMTLQSSEARGDRGWPALALDAAGTAHAIWLDHRGMAASGGARRAHAAHRSGAAHDGVAMAQRSGLYYAAATRADVYERELTKGVCYCCKTALAVGRRGELYAAWRHVYPGNLRDMAFTVSRDGGASFSAPLRVNEDGWTIDGCPDDGPALAVDMSGGVHLVWPTVVSGPHPQGALRYAFTRDGRTFTRRSRIPTLGSLKPSHPQIVVDRTGRIVVAWDEVVDGQRVAAAREIKVRSGDAAFGPVVKLALEGPAMYPVLAATSEGILSVWTTGGEASSIRVRAIDLP